MCTAVKSLSTVQCAMAVLRGLYSVLFLLAAAAVVAYGGEPDLGDLAVSK